MSQGLALGLPYVPQNKPVSSGGGGATAGQPIGFLILLTRAS